MRSHSGDSGQGRPAFRQRLEELLGGRRGKWRHDGGKVLGEAEGTACTTLYSRRLGAPCVVTLESLAEVRTCIEMKLAGLRRACSQQVFNCQECWLAS